MDMRRLLPFAVLLAAHIPVAGDSEPPDLFDADVLTVRSVEPLTNGQTRIDVSASAGIAGGLSVTGAVEFLQGIAYVAPAPDLSMGPFTNVGWTAAGTPCPEWWTAHAVIDAEAAPNDFAAVTQGQVKWLAHSAALSFAEAEVPGGTHAADIVALVGSFTPSNNALPATLGQLKAAAAPFWALLEETWWWYELPFGWRPWTGESPQDFALANVGQAKNAFFFNLPPLYMTNTDFDGDGVPDGHERFLYGTDGDFWDTDGDGLSDGEEIARGTNPLVRDTDGDGYADGTDPDPFAATPWTDADGDGFPDAWRGFWFGTNVIVSASDDTNTNGISTLASLLMGVNPVASQASGFASECGDASDGSVEPHHAHIPGRPRQPLAANFYLLAGDRRGGMDDVGRLDPLRHRRRTCDELDSSNECRQLADSARARSRHEPDVRRGGDGRRAVALASPPLDPLVAARRVGGR